MIYEEVIPNDEQIKTLYTQLMTRVHRISHNNTPSFSEHENFVRNHPYRKWVIILDTSRVLGNAYVKFDNSIGLNLDKAASQNQIRQVLDWVYEYYPPLPSIPSVRIGEFFLNVAYS